MIGGAGACEASGVVGKCRIIENMDGGTGTVSIQTFKLYLNP